MAPRVDAAFSVTVPDVELVPEKLSRAPADPDIPAPLMPTAWLSVTPPWNPRVAPLATVVVPVPSPPEDPSRTVPTATEVLAVYVLLPVRTTVPFAVPFP